MAAFGAFERMMAFRYLRARRQEGFISVIAWFSLLGIALGVATLIIVMAVMNGFRAELLGRIVGLNGHLTIYAQQGAFTEFDAVAGRVRRVADVLSAAPLVEGQVLATANGVSSGAMVRGMRPADLRARRLIADNLRADGQPTVQWHELGATLAAGATLVMITHDPALAARCDRIVEMADGRIVSDRLT